MLLGVRFGASTNFKRADWKPAEFSENHADNCSTDLAKAEGAARAKLLDRECASTYFEFDPYPVRSNSYVVYRVADAPKQWTNVAAKALYMFEVRPAATRVEVLAFSSSDMRPSHCIGYELPGRFEFLSVAPQITKTGGTGSEDWFVWWRRYNLEGTGGYLAILAPGRATINDWSKLFKGARVVEPASCLKQLDPRAPDASRKILIGDRTDRRLTDDEGLANSRKLTEVVTRDGEPTTGEADPIRGENDDPNISELHTAPGLEPEGKLRLIALRAHTCKSEASKSNALCHHDIIVSPTRERLQRPEPYVVRDEINRWLNKGPRPSDNDGEEPDRYRNFVTPPFALGTDAAKAPVMAWLRRGERLGQTYQEKALLRRASYEGVNADPNAKGIGLPVIKLEKYEEGADPLFVTGRTSAKPKLNSLRVAREGSTKVLLEQWNILASDPVEVKPDCRRSDEERLLGDCAQHTVTPVSIATECMSQLDDTWLARPPVVSARASADGAADILFSRLVFKGPPRSQALLQINIARLTDDGGCTLSRKDAQPIETALEDRPEMLPREKEATYRGRVVAWSKHVQSALTDLRGRPTLLLAVDNMHYAVMLDAKNLSRTAVFALNDERSMVVDPVEKN